jgi:hypothetical protein
MRSIIVIVLSFSILAPAASAATLNSGIELFSNRPVRDPFHVSWSGGLQPPAPANPTLSLSTPLPALEQDTTQPLHAAAIEHSDGYKTRLKIHKVASFATLPLFATELWLGQSLYNSSGNVDSKRGVHAAVGAGIVGLFGVNTVTGLWNLFGEDRKDPNSRKLRLTHGLLMLAADAGMAATWAYGPNSNSLHQAATFDSRKATHRDLAIASISVGTAGYLIMLLGHR